MTGKERMMTALTGGKPNRLPVTALQFQQGCGYICSAIDHFFDAPAKNLRAMALAALDCLY